MRGSKKMNSVTPDEIVNVFDKMMNGYVLKSNEKKKFMSMPDFAYLYAMNIKKGKLDEEEEKVFISSDECSLKYLYMYCCFLGDTNEHIHRHWLSMGIKHKNNEWVKRYFNEETSPPKIREFIKASNLGICT